MPRAGDASLSRRRDIARRLSPYVLRASTEAARSLTGPDSAGLYLGYYSYNGIEQAFEAYGVYEALDRLGFDRIQLQLHTADPFEHRLMLYDQEVKPERLLHEIVVRRRQLYFDRSDSVDSRFDGQHFGLLGIEWMCLQNPRQSFSELRPALPGQQYPGLGLGQLVLDLLQLTAERLVLDGIITIPAWFHNAVFYHTRFRYLSLSTEARLQALYRQLVRPLGLHRVAWAIEQQQVCENGQSFEWFHEDMILPLAPALKAGLIGAATRRVIRRTRENFVFTLRDPAEA
ncbi:MAG: hypothetical protein IGS03_11100 [Candidatus Sericytochromatia bacterium]|nr:hypothetical protein [Candidatus Sericytochromatia bacterium]